MHIYTLYTSIHKSLSLSLSLCSANRPGLTISIREISIRGSRISGSCLSRPKSVLQKLTSPRGWAHSSRISF